MYSPLVASPAASERLFRSQETVKAWLESSPTSVLDDHLDGDVSAHSSFESDNSSPVGSPFRQSASSARFLSPCPSVPRQAGLLSPCSSAHHQSGHVRVRAISPPRCPAANRNPTDVSRIDAAQSTYFLSLAYKRAQNREMSTSRDEAEECDSPRSDFSLTSEWQTMLAAGTAAGMSTRDCDSSANYSEYENPYDVLNGGSDAAMFRAHRAHAQVMRPEPCRIRSMEFPKASREHDPSLPQRHSAPQQRRTVNYDMHDLDRISGRISERSRSIEESFSRRMLQHRTMKQPEIRRPGLFEKMQNDIIMAFRKTEEQKAIAEAKRAEKAAARAAEPKLTRRRSSKIPRGCLFLG